MFECLRGCCGVRGVIVRVGIGVSGAVEGFNTGRSVSVSSVMMVKSLLRVCFRGTFRLLSQPVIEYVIMYQQVCNGRNTYLLH